MGYIINEFVVVDFNCTQEAEAELVTLISGLKFGKCFNLTRGNNGQMYLAISPSGSKEGWSDCYAHRDNVNEVLKTVKELGQFVNIKRVTTSEG